MNLGKNLQTLRKAKSISQEKLAEELDVSRQAIGKWESGMVYPDAERLVQISNYFGVSIDELIKGTVSNNVLEVESIMEAEIDTSAASGNTSDFESIEISDSKPDYSSENNTFFQKYRTIRIVIAIALFVISPFIPGEPGAGTIKSFLMFLCIAIGIALLSYNHLSKKHGRKK